MNETSRSPAAPSVKQDSLDQAFHKLLDPIRDVLTRIEARLGEGIQVTEQATVDEPRHRSTRLSVEDAPAITYMFEQRLDRLEETLVDVGANLALLSERVTDRLSDPTEKLTESSISEASDDATWERIILGEKLCQDATLDTLRDSFLDNVIVSNGPARELAGHLILIQAAVIDQVPELLKYVGEAYYRWRPRTSAAEDPMERAVADWLNGLAEAAGLPNSIQLVRHGERFDSSRHVAVERGVEVVAVHGWIVLRDNNRVYTKALVSVS